MIITNARIGTLNKNNDYIENGAIRVDGGVITDIGQSAAMAQAFPGETAFDAQGMLVLPANICAHTHFYGAFARGLGIPGKPPGHFVQVLEKLWWKLDRALDEDAIRRSAQVCLIDAIKHGTTTLIDHHASPSCIDGSLDIIAETVKAAGVRACLCYEVTDRNGDDQAQAGIRENIRFIRKYRQQRDPQIAAMFGLHASMTLSNKTLERCLAESDALETGVHIHAAESISDQIDSVKKYGKRVIQRLHAMELMNSRSILVHCVHIDETEIGLIADSGAFVTHQPRSNMNNGVGTAPVDRMLAANIPVCVGNDGFSNNMWDEWKTVYLVHKLAKQDPRQVQGYDVINMAVHNNAALARLFWPDHPIGTIEKGAAADIVLVDYKPFTPLNGDNLPWHIVFGFDSDMIHSTMSRGTWLMLNRDILVLDENKIIADAMQSAKHVWNRFQKGFY
jgi:putative selenium metabolism protein SsnA